MNYLFGNRGLSINTQHPDHPGASCPDVIEGVFDYSRFGDDGLLTINENGPVNEKNGLNKEDEVGNPINVFKMLLSKGKITQDLANMLMSWRHSGFNVFCGPRIQPAEEEAMENLARYIIRASFSQERMTYIPEDSKVVYRSKDGKEERVFDALEWLAAMGSHVPNKGEQMAHYYGYYSNVSRGSEKRAIRTHRAHFIFRSPPTEAFIDNLHVSTTRSCGRVFLDPQGQIPYD